MRISDWSSDVCSSDLLVVRGEQARTASATVAFQSWFDTEGSQVDQPVARTAHVPLTEDPAAPGVYRAPFPLDDGTAAITGVVGTLSDGSGGQAQRNATRSPAAVSGELPGPTHPPHHAPLARA